MVYGTARSGIPLTIDSAVCLACRRCPGARVCPTKAIRRIDRDEPPFIDVDLCRGCLKCLAACPVRAIVRHGAGQGQP